MKWETARYNAPFHQWTPPELVYPCESSEKDALHALKNAFQPLPLYKEMEAAAIKQNTLVTLDIPIPDGQIAFLENTAEKCTSPQKKHSQEGMRGARHWVQRVDTPEGMFRRLTEGYGVSLMCGERSHQYIRNSNNWRGINGVQLDLDVWYQQPDALKKKLEAEDRDADFIAERLDANEKLPLPVYSQSELFERYPLLPRICSYLIPSASSLYDGRPFKARGIVLFSQPITDQRVYRAFGDILCGELDCVPANVTKNPVAVGFGNTHNAPQAYRNDAPDTHYIAEKIELATSNELSTTKQRNREQKKKAERKAHYAATGHRTGEGENISAFIEQCDPVSEMVKAGWLTPGRGNEYHWHESGNARSCDIVDGSIHIFSDSMFKASPHNIVNEAVGAHRFYLYHLSGWDMTKDSDKPKCREYLFDRGYGSDPKAFAKKQQQPKLQRTDAATDEPTETLDENRANREAATSEFMETDATDTLHFLLVKDATGTGKSHTIFSKAQHHGKRTLAQMSYTKLATQAVDIAFQLGYKNPFHLLGREHNWKKSRIEVIPVKMRTKDLFERNNCLMVDEVKAYTEKRLAPRTYCELKCSFREECLHLAQYKGLGQRDFLVSCTPNLLFDLDMRGYLQLLVNAIDEPSDEELAIDAILGTQSETLEAFDFAILDDYGISGLYSDKAFKASEFKSLQKAWHGTPTAEFATLILKAFKKKKPHKIVKALRNAFDRTTEHHAEISEALTQHARIGIVEYAERPKGSKETQRLLAEKQVRYDDGGTQFIPVDMEAYKELTEKRIPSVHPQELQTQEIGETVIIPHAPVLALFAGVPIEKLTPVWHTRTTPIELLDIFLSSIGNDKNAPIARSFVVGKTSDTPPDAVLTFSIPPQAPVGILPQIALLSATTDTTDTKRAFDGQAVTFSEHAGNPLEWADGVQVYQYTDARLTSASIFQYPKDTDGKRKLQEQPIGLTPVAETRLEKLNNFAKQVKGKTAFVSFKEFTEAPFSETVNGFDIVTHFDTVTGLNFDGLKYLVVFGYPKVKHEAVMEQARRQYASDSEPLPKADPTLRDDKGNRISEYLQLTEEVTVTENGITITERRYKDPRLEKVRHQLATEKLEQAIGRARLVTWTDTETIVFTNAPIQNITDRATLFSSDAFTLAETPNALLDAMHRIAEVEASGDVQAYAEATGKTVRSAYRDTQTTRQQSKAERNAEIIRRHRDGMSQREIERQMKQDGYTKVSRKVISSVLNAVQK